MADDTIQMVKENLVVGKREVEGGAVQVTSHVVETPVEEKVTLHEERVSVVRRPVNRPLTDAAADAFRTRTLSASARSEGAVVGKEARVVEEIGLRKEASDRVKTVRDTVRETKVDVEQLPGSAGTARTTRTAPRPGNLALAARSKFPRRDVAPYWAAQLSGAIGRPSWSGQPCGRGACADALQMLLVEALIAFTLVLAVISTATDDRVPPGTAAVAIGFSLAAGVLLGGSAGGGGATLAGPRRVERLGSLAPWTWMT